MSTSAEASFSFSRLCQALVAGFGYGNRTQTLDPQVAAERAERIARLMAEDRARVETAAWGRRVDRAIGEAVDRNATYHATYVNRRTLLEGILQLPLEGTPASRDADFAVVQRHLAGVITDRPSEEGVSRDLEFFLSAMERAIISPSGRSAPLDARLASARVALNVLDAYGRDKQWWPRSAPAPAAEEQPVASGSHPAPADEAPLLYTPTRDVMGRPVLGTAWGIVEPVPGSPHEAYVRQELGTLQLGFEAIVEQELAGIRGSDFSSLAGSRTLALKALLTRGHSSELDLTQPGALARFFDQELGFRFTGVEAATAVGRVLSEIESRLATAEASHEAKDRQLARHLREYRHYLLRVRALLVERGHTGLTGFELAALRDGTQRPALETRARVASGPVWGIEAGFPDRFAEAAEKAYVEAELLKLRQQLDESFVTSIQRVPPEARSWLTGNRDIVLRALLTRGESVGRDLTRLEPLRGFLKAEIGARATGKELATLIEGVLATLDRRIAASASVATPNGRLNAERLFVTELRRYRAYLSIVQSAIEAEGYLPSQDAVPVESPIDYAGQALAAVEPVFTRVRDAISAVHAELPSTPNRLVSLRRGVVENLVRLGDVQGQPLYEASRLDDYLRGVVERGEIRPDELRVAVAEALRVIDGEVAARRHPDAAGTPARRSQEVRLLQDYRAYWESIGASLNRIGIGFAG